MPASLHNLPQEIVDDIVSLIVDDIESQIVLVGDSRDILRHTFALRLLAKTFDNAFIESVFASRTSRVHLAVNERFLGVSLPDVDIINPTMAFHPLFRKSGTSLQVFLPLAEEHMWRDVAEGVAACVMTCRSLRDITVFIDRQCDKGIDEWYNPMMALRAVRSALCKLSALNGKNYKKRYVYFGEGIPEEPELWGLTGKGGDRAYVEKTTKGW